jgi:RNA-directed DNA polymerase
MTTKLDGIATKAKSQTKLRFTALAHLITPAFLVETWRQMNRRGASGVDRETTQEFERNLDQRCQDIVDRLKARQYQAPPVRRVEIPKAGGKTRPLGIPTVEDRLVQRAVARILEAIYEADFLPFSYGFRPGRSPHLALQALRKHLTADKVTYLFETDIRGFFDHLSHDWLMRMLALRIGDPVILRLIAKWLKAGALVNGIIVKNDKGSPQGGPISPILANIYLHYALDLWFERRYARGCQGAAYLVRFADDFVACFQHAHEAQRFQVAVADRLGGFGLELAQEKTRLLTFGRFARDRLKGKSPETFVFLGFKHVCGTDRWGKFVPLRIPSTKSCRKFLDRVHEWLIRYMHLNVWKQQAQLRMMLNGFYQYFGLHHCRPTLARIHAEVYRQWVRILKRRSQRQPTWKYLATQPWFVLPLVSRALHPLI